MKKIRFGPNVSREIRAIDQPAALQILTGLARYAKTGEGSVKALQGEVRGMLRLRIGSHRVVFDETADTITVHRIRHRKDAYS